MLLSAKLGSTYDKCYGRSKQRERKITQWAHIDHLLFLVLITDCLPCHSQLLQERDFFFFFFALILPLPWIINYHLKKTDLGYHLHFPKGPFRNHNILFHSMMLRFYQSKWIKYSINIVFKFSLFSFKAASQRLFFLSPYIHNYIHTPLLKACASFETQWLSAFAYLTNTLLFRTVTSSCRFLLPDPSIGMSHYPH